VFFFFLQKKTTYRIKSKAHQKMKKIIMAACVLAAFQTSVSAQVQYKLERLPNSRYYIVSAIPDASYAKPMNIVSTAQVTLKVPAGGFKVGSIQPFGTRWTLNGRSNAPQENPDFDYINFGLRDLGTARLDFKKGAAIPLFAFEASGTCEGEVALMDNKTDELQSDNVGKINVGNQITVLGAGGDAWKGNVVGAAKAPCFEMTAIEKGMARGAIVVYPNPVQDELALTFMVTKKDAKEGFISLHDAAGRVIFREKKQFNEGLNEQHFDVSNLAAGTYQIEIEGLVRKNATEKVVKM
jgi:Secretion system C-terminal sorting domain